VSRHLNTFRVSLILAIAVIGTFALGAHQSVRSDQRQTEHPDRHQKHRELWVTHQRDSIISVLSFPEGKLLDQFSLPDGTRPHITTFHSGAYAYISGMGNGTVSIVDAKSRQLVQTLTFAPALAHQGKVSPDGTTMLVSVVSTRTLYKVAVDEQNQSWTPAGSVEFPVGKPPVCTVFSADSLRAYVSTMMDGIVIVDVPSMRILGTLPTDGFVACGMIKPTPDADHAVVAAAGNGGHIYTLDMENDTLEDRGTLGAASWHSFNMTPDEALGFGTSPNSDEVVIIDLTTDPVTNMGTIVLQPLPSTGNNNQPDAMGGGEPLVNGILPVTLRAAGQLALVKTVTGRIKRFIELAPPSPPGTFNPMNCNDCAVHGVTVRRTVVSRRGRPHHE
jgi:DNA-binding beta-propeller fold protein YncE